MCKSRQNDWAKCNYPFSGLDGLPQKKHMELSLAGDKERRRIPEVKRYDSFS